MSVEKMSLTLALGICFGIMPFLGVTTYLLALLAIILRLNIPALQFVNYAVYIVQVVLYLPFLKLSRLIFYPEYENLNLNDIAKLYQNDFLGALKEFWYLNLGAVLIWAIIAIPMGFLIYHLSYPIIYKQKLRLSAIETTSQE